MESYQALANAIVELAVKDYKKADFGDIMLQTFQLFFIGKEVRILPVCSGCAPDCSRWVRTGEVSGNLRSIPSNSKQF